MAKIPLWLFEEATIYRFGRNYSCSSRSKKEQPPTLTQLIKEIKDL